MKQIVYVASPESQQLHVWQMDNEGLLTLLQVVDTPGQGQPMAISPAKTHLYIGVRPDFGVVSYRIDEQGRLTEAGMAPLPGSPTHLGTDRQGRFVFCASYSNSCVSVSPIDEHGIAGATSQVLHDLLNCHSANVDPTNQVLWVPCLKEDRIRLFNIAADGGLRPYRPEAVATVSGAGPRHMVFHPHRLYAYVVNELNSSVNVYAQDEAGGAPRIIQTLDLMPPGFTDTRWAADIHITPDGRYLYACDRTASVITRFAVSEDGSTLDVLGYQPTETQPRGFNIDAEGRFLIAAGQKSGHIGVYRIEGETGGLTPLARYPVGQGPMWVTILDL
ncbi:6-phosphogluconolactonase [Acerihabitans arboris]|uniref:6-phosphogluconolactonase n=1 Tax=Acerihabitans arboris TaxID=2691583 RepID=A0A845SJH6_9GAMM|nr:6-phosphogluconolactonase [Acerihabitans arboris]NDL62791.1 6-phosphogluconolactonase [Acerihabitans arboris]